MHATPDRVLDPGRVAVLSDTNRIVDDVMTAWLEVAATMSMRDLAHGPKATPFVSLASGASGIAYVLGRIGRARGDATISAASRRWFAAVRRAAKRRDAFRLKGWATTRHSVMFGRLGVSAAAALLAPSRATINDFITRGKYRSASAPSEVMFGLAGGVLASIAIARASGSREVADLATDLATRLATSEPPPPGGLAHGNVGALIAQLVAAHWRGDPVAVKSAATALGSLTPAEVLARNKRLRRSWCNGLAGHTIGWVIGAELAADDRCHAHALAAGTHLLEELDEDGGTVCCGLGGRAYALLAIARIAPGGPWVEHATRVTTRALAFPLRDAGILQGFAGLIGLAHDLKDPATARFPFVDVL